MIRTIRRAWLAFICVVVCSQAALATPTLQLGIQGGTYDWTTQTIVASSNVFTLYAFLIPDTKNTLTDDYYLSMGVSPQYGPAGGNLGSFIFTDNQKPLTSTNPKTIDVTADMVYGTPPVETLQGYDPGDLPRPGIYPTYFTEYGFKFTSSRQSGVYNTQATAGLGPVAGTGMYYMSLTFDVTHLAAPYVIHFDLYNTAVFSGGDIDVTQFAPFSHDAESSPSTSVPEPSSLILLGSGLAGLGFLRRKNARTSQVDA